VNSRPLGSGVDLGCGGRGREEREAVGDVGADGGGQEVVGLGDDGDEGAEGGDGVVGEG
jgi:hypothetical protein